jgi:hypothetical protein
MKYLFITLLIVGAYFENSHLAFLLTDSLFIKKD